MPSSFLRKACSVALALLCTGLAAFSQEASVLWKVSASPLDDGIWHVKAEGSIAPGMHIYGPDHRYNAVKLQYGPDDFVLTPLSCESQSVSFKDEEVYFDSIVLSQDVRPGGATLKGSISWLACQDEVCGFPEEQEFETSAGENKPVRSLWSLILEAILWGFAMLLTPCVFPMVPMTVSFFLKSSDSPARGRFKALMYGLFIVLLYTVPIAVIVLLTRLLGGDAITADIFNWLSTHWLPNLLFFAVFFVFALSFFGAFEITLPASWTTATDAKSAKGGLAGVFFLALTLVLVSFSCTGPIVGSVLIQSTRGVFIAPVVTMLAFSLAFALPFTLLALFPSLIGKLRSGSWLGSVKVVLGFVELALGMKFLSTADQTYHWHILDREVYLAIWIAIFILLTLYLLGILRLRHGEASKGIGPFRLLLAGGVLAFVIYLIPGMWGAPLKALSGYLPPMSTQDFVIGADASAPGDPVSDGPQLSLPHGLSGYFSLEEGLEAAKAQGKPVFVDITGHGCVNCREMEARVWSDPSVLERLRNNFVIVALYTDDKTRLPEQQWLTTPGGRQLKTVGSVNAQIARSRFEVNAQPNYLLLSPEGKVLAGPRGYNLSVPGFVEFLDSVL
ncbi:MAG: thioredoxin family protein [Bacteroidales bacterium]|nr:thioredoxin family protein [Bacteroidales bacterium]